MRACSLLLVSLSVVSLGCSSEVSQGADVAPATGPDAGLDAAAAPDAAVSDAAEGGPDADLPAAQVEPDAGAGPDAAQPPDAARPVDAGAPLTPCPTSGAGAILAPGPCVVFTPEQAGASAQGDSATRAQYALGPSGAAKGALVVQLNGSLGTPAGQIAEPARNIYNAASEAGFHVLGLSYKSTLVVGQVCANAPACFEPTRLTLILGTYQAGTPAVLKGIRPDEGIVFRLEAALRLLAARQPGGGWDQFLTNPTASDPAERIAWPKVISSGHSQGGGHAAMLGKRFPLRQVVQQSSTCDAVDGAPAPWTAAATAWATDPATRYVGFAAPTTLVNGKPEGDTLCPYHLAVWQSMGMAPANQHDDAATCGVTGNTHGASIGCVENYARWKALFQ